MPTVLESLPQRSRVLLVRLRSLGDCVLTTPAIELLKRFRPDLSLGVVVEPRFAGVYENNPHVSEILPPSKWAVLRFRPHVTINLHGGPTSAVLTLLSAARTRAGFAHYRNGWAYNVRIPRAQEILGEDRKVHTAEHVASAMFFVGVPQSEIPPARLYPATSTPEGGRYAVIHAFASAPEKAWPLERFVAVARRLRDEMQLSPVFLGADSDDFASLSEFRTLRGAPLSEVKQILAAAQLFVGNDSGPAHMAAAFRIPVVVLFGASDPVIWAPWKTRAETLVSSAGLSEIAVDEVFRCIRRLEVPA
jgi:ADP-heptose:LPS heptosyltransferase